MEDHDDADLFAYTDITWQVTPPPDRYPVPAQYAGELAVGDEVTIGIPGRYFIDDQVVARLDRETIALPGESAARESIGVSAPIHYWMARAYPGRAVVMQWWPVEYTWIYRDARQPGGDGIVAPEGVPQQRSWFDAVQPNLDVPAVRRARPARESGPLTGRLLRLQHAPGEWSWRMAVSEPVDVNGDICVHTLPSSAYWCMQVTYYGDEALRKVEAIPLHRLFAYI